MDAPRLEDLDHDRFLDSNDADRAEPDKLCGANLRIGFWFSGLTLAGPISKNEFISETSMFESRGVACACAVGERHVRGAKEIEAAA